MRRKLGTIAAVTCVFLALPALAPALAGAQTLYVNSPADSDSSAVDCLTVTVSTQAGTNSTCTLRGAIEEVTHLESTDPGSPNTIEFTVCGPFSITSQLPTIPEDTFIDGSDGLNDPSNPNDGCDDTFDTWITDGDGGYDSFADDNYGFAHLQGPGNGAFDGLVLSGSGSSISGVVLGGFRNAIVMEAPGGDSVFNSAIGNDAYEGGPINPPNTGDGVDVTAGSADDVVGYAPADGDENVQDDIYGNGGWGVHLADGSGPTVVGHNFIGTDTSGDQYACDAPIPPGYNCVSQDASQNPVGTPIPDGNGLGGVYDDGSGDVIGGVSSCATVTDICTGNVISGNLGPGVKLASDASHDTVDSNEIGEALNYYQSPANDDGALPNSGPGVEDNGSNDTIGGTVPGAANLISGNAGPGVLLQGASAKIEDNLIGLNFTGVGASPNQGAGIRASDGLGVANGLNRIIDNTIGGNTGPGIQLDQAGDTVNGNYIGTAGDHSSALPNSVGILADRGPEQIGGPTNSPNVITDNTGAGIEVVDPASSTYTTGVDINDNSIFDNGGLGIDLGGDGVTAQHIPDTASGPNGWNNYPVLTSASAANGQWTVHGMLTGPPSTYTSIYLYGDSACDPSGYGEGQTLIGDGAATTDANGNVAFTLSGTGTLPAVLSATALATNGSSEFSPCIEPTGGSALSVSQAVTGGATVISGDPTDIDISLTNDGPAQATNATITVNVPSGETIAAPPAGCPSVNGATLTCDIGTISSGASLDVHVVLTPLAGTQTLTDTVSVSSDQVQLSSVASTLSATVTPNPSQPSGQLSVGAPKFGSYLRLSRNSGTVSAELPNGQRINVSRYAIIPVGTIVTATSGQAGITAQLKNGKPTQAAFRYGRFQVTQPRTGTGAVDVKLDAPLTGCSAKQLSTDLRSGDVFTAAAGLLTAPARWPLKGKPKPKPKKPTSRRLWGHDAGGRYTITGNRGAATVQGTTWEVLDTCTTTTVIVYQDSVKVVGFGDTVPKRATVTAGHRVVLRAAGSG